MDDKFSQTTEIGNLQAIISQILNSGTLGVETDEYVGKFKKLLPLEHENATGILDKTQRLLNEILDRQAILKRYAIQSTGFFQPFLGMSSSDRDVEKINTEIQQITHLNAVTTPPLPIIQILSHGDMINLIKELQKLTSSTNVRFIIVPVFPHEFTQGKTDSQIANHLSNKMGHYATLVIDTQNNSSYYFDSMGKLHSADETPNVCHYMALPLIKQLGAIDLTPDIQIQSDGTNSCAEWYKAISIKICELISKNSNNISHDLNSWALENSSQVEQNYQNRSREKLQKKTESQSSRKSSPSNQKDKEKSSTSNSEVAKFEFKFENLEEAQEPLDKKKGKSNPAKSKGETKQALKLFSNRYIQSASNELLEKNNNVVTTSPLLFSSLSKLFSERIEDEEKSSIGNTAENVTLNLLSGREEERFVLIPIYPHGQNIKSKNPANEIGYYTSLVVDTQSNQVYYLDCMGKLNNPHHVQILSTLKKLNIIDLTPENGIKKEEEKSIAETTIAWHKHLCQKLCKQLEENKEVKNLPEIAAEWVKDEIKIPHLDTTNEPIQTKQTTAKKSQRPSKYIRVPENPNPQIDSLKRYVENKYQTDISNAGKLCTQMVENHTEHLFMLGESGIYFIFDSLYKLVNDNKLPLDKAISKLESAIKSPRSSNILHNLKLSEYSEGAEIKLFSPEKSSSVLYTLAPLSPHRLQEHYKELKRVDFTLQEESDRVEPKNDLRSSSETPHITSEAIVEEDTSKQKIKIIRYLPKEFIDELPWQMLADCIINQPYEDQLSSVLSEGKDIYAYRPNHGVTHSIRQLIYVKEYMQLISDHGKSNYKDALNHLTGQEKACLDLAMFLYRSGRTNEAAGSANWYNTYRSRRIYEQIALGYGYQKDLISLIGEGINIYTGLSAFMAFDPSLSEEIQSLPVYKIFDNLNAIFLKINNLPVAAITDLAKKYPDYASHLNDLFTACCSKEPNLDNVNALLKIIQSQFEGLPNNSDNQDLIKYIKIISSLLPKNLSNIEGFFNEGLINTIKLKWDKGAMISNLLKLSHSTDLVRCKSDHQDIVEHLEPHMRELFDENKVNINYVIDEFLDFAREANLRTGGKIECPSPRFGLVLSYDVDCHKMCSENVIECMRFLSTHLTKPKLSEKQVKRVNLFEFKPIEKEKGKYSTYSEIQGVISPYRNRKGEIIARGEYATELIHRKGEIIECVRINSALFYTPNLVPVQGKPGTAITENGYRDIHQDFSTKEIIWSSGKEYKKAAYIAAGRLRRAGLWIAKYRAEHAWEYNPKDYAEKRANDIIELLGKNSPLQFFNTLKADILPELLQQLKQIPYNEPSYKESEFVALFKSVAEFNDKIDEFSKKYNEFLTKFNLNDEKGFKELLHEKLKEFLSNNSRQYYPFPKDRKEAQSNVEFVEETKAYLQLEKIYQLVKESNALIAEIKKLPQTISINNIKSTIDRLKKEASELSPKIIDVDFAETIEKVTLDDSDTRYVLQNPRILSFLVPLDTFENIIHEIVLEDTKTEYDHAASVDKRFEPNQFDVENRVIMNLRANIVPDTLITYHFNHYLVSEEQRKTEGTIRTLSEMGDSIGQSPHEMVLDNIWTSGTGFAAQGGIDLNERASYLANIYNTWQVLNDSKNANLLGVISIEDKMSHLKNFVQFVVEQLSAEDDKLIKKHEEKDILLNLENIIKGEKVDIKFQIDLEQLMEKTKLSANEARIQYTIMDMRMTQVNGFNETMDTDIGARPFTQIFCENRIRSESKNIKLKLLNEMMVKVGKEIKSELAGNKKGVELANNLITILSQDPELKYRLLKPSTDLPRSMMFQHIIKMIETFDSVQFTDLESKRNLIIVGLLFHDMEKHESQLRAESAKRPDQADNLTRDLMKRYMPLINNAVEGITEKEMNLLLIAVANNPFSSPINSIEDFKNGLKKIIQQLNITDIEISNSSQLNDITQIIQYSLMIASVQHEEEITPYFNKESLPKLITGCLSELTEQKGNEIKFWSELKSEIDLVKLSLEVKDKDSSQESPVKSTENSLIPSSKSEKISFVGNTDINIIKKLLEVTNLNIETLEEGLQLVSYNDFRNMDKSIVALLKELDPLDEEKLKTFFITAKQNEKLSSEETKTLEKFRQDRGNRLMLALDEYKTMIPNDKINLLINELATSVLREIAHKDFLLYNESLNHQLKEQLKGQTERVVLISELSQKEIPNTHIHQEFARKSQQKKWDELHKQAETLEEAKRLKQEAMSRKDTTNETHSPTSAFKKSDWNPFKDYFDETDSTPITKKEETFQLNNIDFIIENSSDSDHLTIKSAGNTTDSKELLKQISEKLQQKGMSCKIDEDQQAIQIEKSKDNVDKQCNDIKQHVSELDKRSNSVGLLK